MSGLRWTLPGVVVVGGVGLWAGAGCSILTGVDFDRARLATEGDEAGVSTPPEGEGPPPDPAPRTPSREPSTCTPEPNVVVCADRCGPTEDNCSEARACSEDCGAGKACTDGACTCVSDGSFCTNRCGLATDNCGRAVECGGCTGPDTCIDNTCGCVPEPVSTTCKGKGCGTAKNNCGQTVACGNNGACAAPGAICKTDGSCCSDDGVACSGRCGGVKVTNNCGQSVGCPQACPTSLVCIVTSCCTPEPLATTCAGVACGPNVNNCGQAVQCPDTCDASTPCGVGGAGPNACCVPAPVSCSDAQCGPKLNNCGQPGTCPDKCDLHCFRMGCNHGTCIGTSCKCATCM